MGRFSHHSSHHTYSYRYYFQMIDILGSYRESLFSDLSTIYRQNFFNTMYICTLYVHSCDANSNISVAIIVHEFGCRNVLLYLLNFSYYRHWLIFSSYWFNQHWKYVSIQFRFRSGTTKRLHMISWNFTSSSILTLAGCYWFFLFSRDMGEIVAVFVNVGILQAKCLTVDHLGHTCRSYENRCPVPVMCR